VRPRLQAGASRRPLNFTFRHRAMPHHGWISVGEFANAFSARAVSQRLTVEEVPHKIETTGLRSDPTCWIWVPPEWANKAKEILSSDAVPEDDLTKLALSYPPPDDAGNLK
jgi:hypothetical protein